MEENMFLKFPNWLRWIIFIPAAILFYIIATFLSRFSMSYMGFEPNSPYSRTMEQISSIGGFLYAIYLCIPKNKEIVTGIFSILWSFLGITSIYSYVINNNWDNWDFLICIVSTISCIYIAIYMFIEHGKIAGNSKVNIDNLN